ncbi:MAG: SDR family oxidoreductase [Chloroflexi bacterium]|nr:SDR family oxidoreductase [Chloroflexota bacterium]
MGLEGRAAIVTGGTGVLGRAVVRRYLEAGAHVAAAVRDRAKGEALRAELGELAGTPDDARLFLVDADPADRAAMDAAVEEVLRRWGRLDALANLAGGYDRGTPWDLDAMERQWAANVRTAVTATAACLRPMRARAYGRIVSVGSVGAERGGAESAGYAMSKSAIVRWTESLAAALKDEGITANVVLPSIIDHPVNRERMPKADPTKWVRPEELAAAILFLTSPEASGVTGAAIPVVGRV